MTVLSEKQLLITNVFYSIVRAINWKIALWIVQPLHVFQTVLLVVSQGIIRINVMFGRLAALVIFNCTVVFIQVVSICSTRKCLEEIVLPCKKCQLTDKLCF